jgi:hypothetical protein
MLVESKEHWNLRTEEQINDMEYTHINFGARNTNY